MDTAHTYALVAGLAIWWLTIGTINALKGKWWMALVFNGPIAAITAARVAKPGSWWDRNAATAEDHAKSVARFTQHTT